MTLSKWRMVRLVPVVTILGILLLASVPSPAAAITYGVPDSTHTAVGTIILGVPGFQYQGFQLCTGSLIAPRVFLTAGHCTDFLLTSGWPLAYMWVSFDEFPFTQSATYVGVAEVHSHPNYSSPVVGPVTPPVSNPYDVGVVILAQPVTDREPIALPPSGFLDSLQDQGILKDSRFLNVGYGTDEHNDLTLQRENSTSGFLSLHKAWLYMSQNIHLGDGGTCYGDSGGPIFYKTGAAEQLVVITSWGDTPCKATNNAYRIDIPSSLTFLHQMMLDFAS